MRINAEKLKKLCRSRQIPLKTLLREAKVSRTAYYSLLRKESVLPKSIDRVARRLEVSPLCFLSDVTGQVRRIRELQARTDDICLRDPS